MRVQVRRLGLTVRAVRESGSQSALVLICVRAAQLLLLLLRRRPSLGATNTSARHAVLCRCAARHALTRVGPCGVALTIRKPGRSQISCRRLRVTRITLSRLCGSGQDATCTVLCSEKHRALGAEHTVSEQTCGSCRGRYVATRLSDGRQTDT